MPVSSFDLSPSGLRKPKPKGFAAKKILPTAYCLLPAFARGSAILTVVFATSLLAGTAAPQAKCEMTAEELEAVKALFQKLADAFNRGDAQAVAILFVNRTSHRHA